MVDAWGKKSLWNFFKRNLQPTNCSIYLHEHIISMCQDHRMNREVSKRSSWTAILAGDHPDSQPQHTKFGSQKEPLQQQLVS